MITWRIGDAGFDMTLSGMVPIALAHALPDFVPGLLDGAGVAGIQFIGGRFVAYSSAYPVAFVVHENTRLLPCRAYPSAGGTLTHNSGAMAQMPGWTCWSYRCWIVVRNCAFLVKTIMRVNFSVPRLICN
jgi:hypothetical protein